MAKKAKKNRKITKSQLVDLQIKRLDTLVVAATCNIAKLAKRLEILTVKPTATTTASTITPERWQDKLVDLKKNDYYFIISPGANTHYGFLSAKGTNRLTDRKPEHAFRTEEQAELLKEKMLLMQEMYAFAHVKNEGKQPNWNSSDVAKFGIKYTDRNTLKAYCNYECDELIFGVALNYKHHAEEMLSIFGGRIKKYYNQQY